MGHKRNNNKKKYYQHTSNQVKGQRIKDLNSIKSLMEKNISSARKEVIGYIEQYPSDMFGIFLFASIEEQLGNLSSAKEQYQLVADSNQNNKYSAIIRLGDIARKEGFQTLAKKYYRQAIEESPNEELYATYALAKLERMHKNHEEALRVLRTIKNPNSKIITEMIANLTELGRVEEANDVLNKLQPSSNDDMFILLEQGKLARRQKDLEKARLYYQKVLAAGNKNEFYCKAMHELIQMEYGNCEYQTVISYCQELLSLGQDFNKDINFFLGMAQQKLGIYDQAYKNFEIATESQDFDTRSSGFYYLGNLQFLMGNFDEAIESLKQSLNGEIIPRNSINAKLISIYLKQGKYQEMEELIEALKRDYKDVYDEAGLHIAELLLAKATGKPLKKRYEYEGYAERQAITYRPTEALYHIKDQHASSRQINSNFSSQINVDELFEEIKIHMIPDNKVNADAMDLYEIDWPYAGYDQRGNIVHRIRVVAFPNTLNILTMYPSDKDTTPRQSDILKQMEQEKQKTYSNSRIAKFNKRFNLE